jgi:hypothetical protein
VAEYSLAWWGAENVLRKTTTSGTSWGECVDVLEEAKRLVLCGRGADTRTALAVPAKGTKGPAASVAGGVEEVTTVFEGLNSFSAGSELAAVIGDFFNHHESRQHDLRSKIKVRPAPLVLRAVGRMGVGGLTWGRT